MSVGFAADKTAIDTRSGSLSVQVRDLFKQIKDFETFLAGKTDAVLTAAPYNYTQDEVTLLKSAFTQLSALVDVATGADKQAGATAPNNYLFFSNQLTGVN